MCEKLFYGERAAGQTTLTKHNMNHIEIAIITVRASGPVTRSQIASEIAMQAINGNRENCLALADAAINHGTETGWIESYDEESYVIA